MPPPRKVREPEERAEVGGTQTQDPMLIQHLNNDMNDTRRLIITVEKDYSRMDDLTMHETLNRIHGVIVDDLYYRVKELCEPRGRLGEFESDIAILVVNVGDLLPDAPDYYSKLMGLYRRLLARYQFWLDLIGVLLPNVPPMFNDAEKIIEAMEIEYEREMRRQVLEQRFKRPPPVPVAMTKEAALNAG